MFNFATNLRTLHVCNHLMLIPAIIYGDWWMWIAAFLWWYVIGTFGISIGFHRLLSHKSFKTYEWFEKFCTYIACLATGGTPLGWVGAHRMHHTYVETEKDPHSPKVIGWFRTYLHLWGDVKIEKRFVKDLLHKKHVMFAHKYYFSIILGWATLLFLINPLLGVFGYCVPATLAFHAYSHINTFGHLFGYRTYDTNDQSRNNWFVNILTCGEGWHNNHHKYPGRYRIGQKWWEWDQSAWILENCGLIK